MCPDTGWDEPLVPGFGPDNEGRFARDQPFGICCAYAFADKACADLKMLGRWPEGADFIAGCSALDLHVLAYDRYKKNNTIDGFFEGRSYDPATLAEIAVSRGVCPERFFASEIYGSSARTLTDPGDYRRTHESSAVGS